jgi:multidrug resistance protein MdtO
VAFEGFSAPTQLAPARDRLVGILLALVVMALVFDLLWPVRTVTAMRSSLAAMMHIASDYLRLANRTSDIVSLRRRANAFRDEIGKAVGNVRTLAETVEYEFGVDIDLHVRSSQMILDASLSLIAFFWNQFAVLHREEDIDFLTQPQLVSMRCHIADAMDIMATATVLKNEFAPRSPASLVNSSILTDPRYGEFAQNSIDRYLELQTAVARLRTLA